MTLCMLDQYQSIIHDMVLRYWTLHEIAVTCIGMLPQWKR